MFSIVNFLFDWIWQRQRERAAWLNASSRNELKGVFNRTGLSSIEPILAITRHQLPSRITRRDRTAQLLQFGFEKVVCDDQCLDRLARIPAASCDGLICSRL